jgi:hypothetical protein
MALLAGVNYDPAAAVAKATSSRIAVTAFDTTNLRLTFTTPDNGCVLVRIRCNLQGATTFPTILLGVLQSSTVIGRVSPVGALPGTAVATTNVTQEAVFAVSGLGAGNSLTWDAAYGVEILLAATNINYGGPNNATTNNAWGGLQFEIWEAPNLLGVKNYDPTTAVSKSTTADLAMTAIDTTNLRIAFTAPGSGKVWVRLKGVLHGATTFPQILLGVMDGATVKGRGSGMGGLKTTAVATAQLAVETEFLVTGLTPGASLSYDAAYGVETPIASTGLKYGGPNNTTTDDAWGAFQFEIWEA